MNKLIPISLLFILLTTNSYAGRTHLTTIDKLIVKSTYIEIWTVAAGGCGSNPNMWTLTIPTDSSSTEQKMFFQSMYSGLLASKTSEKKVDIVGNSTCGVGEE